MGKEIRTIKMSRSLMSGLTLIGGIFMLVDAEQNCQLAKESEKGKIPEKEVAG